MIRDKIRPLIVVWEMKKMDTKRLTLYATCPMGLEAVVAQELKQLGYETKTDNGRVSFQGTLRDVVRCNLWLRTADRVLIHMGQFRAVTFDDLFEGTKAIDWAAWIPAHGEFPVEGKSAKSRLESVPACQGIVKKAIVEKLKQAHRVDWFEENGPRYRVEFALMDDVATITLDTTGASLHKRGYRKLVTEAPIKETMAAAMLLLSRWTPNRPLYDPFCGSGTIPIEAAMIGLNMAPGLNRAFPAEHWSVFPYGMWDDGRDEAYEAMRDEVELNIVGSDMDPKAIEVAEAALRAAGLKQSVTLTVTPVAKAKPLGEYGVIVTNPPYGERLGSQAEAEIAARELANLAKQLPTWSFFVISPAKTFEHHFERKADKRRKLYNGRIECQYYQFFGPLPPRKTQ
jgi:putative N6-adenine-specific DNA methylase